MKTLFMIVLLLNFSCAHKIQEKVRDLKYSAYEKIGVEKRDLFKRDVAKVKDSQEETGESFKDALTKLKDVSGFNGGDLEKHYTALNDSYKKAQEDAATVHMRITDLEVVAGDLFQEWQGEISQIKSSDMRGDSTSKLRDTRKRFSALDTQLHKSESRMQPLLDRFHDQVLYLKHNLNAAAVSGLKTEASKIEGDIERLMAEMNQSMKQADDFIKTL